MGIDPSLVGSRRAVRAHSGAILGISADDFRGQPTLQPTLSELAPYSQNPRNRHGDWYQAHVEGLVRAGSHGRPWRACPQDEARPLMAGYISPVYNTHKIPDLVVRDRAMPAYLGLELKYLHGDGSLVRPKALVDAIDFTHRPIDCIYVIDGPGWKAGKNVEYLARWWQFSAAATLVSTLDDYFA